jgi:hypothetical protein
MVYSGQVFVMSAPAPYGLAVIDSCLTCHMREDRLFCNLPPATLRAFDALKQLATYPNSPWIKSPFDPKTS